jgi:hypothetical protein
MLQWCACGILHILFALTNTNNDQRSNYNSYFKLVVGTLAPNIGGRCTALGVAVPPVDGH